MPKNLSLFVSLVLMLVMFSACQVQRFTVGDGPRGKSGQTTVYSQTKDVYLLAGLISLTTSSQPATPPADKYRGYQIKTSYSAIDALITFLTLGIIHTRTKKVLVYTQEERADVKERYSK